MRGWIVVAVAGCGSADQAPSAWPLIRELSFTEAGVDTDDACRNQAYLNRWSHRDLAKTEVRVDGGETDTCIVPVDWEHEQFVLQTVSCRRTDFGRNRADVDISVLAGGSGGVVQLSFPGTPGDAGAETIGSASRDFGAGLVVQADISAFTVGATGSCQVIGYYLDRGAPALGPVRIRDTQRRPDAK